MSGNQPQEPISEIARRAIALLSVVHHRVEIIEDDDMIWEMLGDTREEKIATVLALASVGIGLAAVIGDPGELLREYAARADELDTYKED